MKHCSYINIYKILHNIVGISHSLHKHYPSNKTGDKHRRASSAKLPQAVLAVCLSAAQPLAAPERVPFFPYSLGKQRIGRRVYCSTKIKQNFIKGASSPLSHRVRNYNQKARAAIEHCKKKGGEKPPYPQTKKSKPKTKKGAPTPFQQIKF